MVQAVHDMHVHTIISVWLRFDLGTDTLAELDKAGAVLPGVYPHGWGRWYDAWNVKGRGISPARPMAPDM
ncbi:MAG: hypothetical protein ACTHLA_00290 [Asticcacaulis sp.]|uniref:hypothetical protein n=1 Tax=Asticcacaulis sp. TaxID=1872648 RepID=UPI003F7BC273